MRSAFRATSNGFDGAHQKQKHNDFQHSTLDNRSKEASRIREKYPDRIPVIVERAEKSNIDDIDKKK